MRRRTAMALQAQTTDMLRELRHQTGVTHERVASLETKVESLGSKVDSLEHGLAASESRLATEVAALARAVDGVQELLRERLHDRYRR